MSDDGAWAVLPPDVHEWLGLQRRHSRIVAEDEMLVETFPRGPRHPVAPFLHQYTHGIPTGAWAHHFRESRSFSTRMICSSVNLAFFIVCSLVSRL